MLGQKCADVLYGEIKDRLDTGKRVPKLAVVQVGDDPASSIYIKYKRAACEKLGFGFQLFKFDEKVSTIGLLSVINDINQDDEITGCIVQLPLPEHIDKYRILNCVDPNKDVDCFNFENIGKLYLGTQHAKFIPATAYGIYKFIKINQIETKGKLCVIIGKSSIVGRPLQLLLSDEEDCAATTVLCDKWTNNLFQITKMADILIVCAGKHHLINSSKQIKKGCVVIDVGIHRLSGAPDGKTKIQGDVDYEAVKDSCSFITPVPGGVGPMTVAGLMWNLSKGSFKD